MVPTRKLKIAILILLGIFITGMLGYHYFEGWSYLESLYMTIITLSTVGYGDYYPRTPEGMIFTILL
ncbi:MAG: potassium channel family protein, partial [Syntrophales bacterium]